MARSKLTARRAKDKEKKLNKKQRNKEKKKAKKVAARLAKVQQLASASVTTPGSAASTSEHNNKESEMSSLEKVEAADIDEGRFKYVLIKVHHSPEGGPETSKFIVRGYCSAEYHADVYDQVVPAIEKLGLDCECVGGGRILHEPNKKSIEVFGYSQGYGRADHSISVEILKKKYPDYEKITFSNEGY